MPHRRGEKPYVLGGRARNCRVCKLNNLQGNFCQFKKDGVVCPEQLQVCSGRDCGYAWQPVRSLLRAQAPVHKLPRRDLGLKDQGELKSRTGIKE